MRRVHQPDSMPGYTLPRYAYRTPPEISKAQGAAHVPPHVPLTYPVIVVGAGVTWNEGDVFRGKERERALARLVVALSNRLPAEEVLDAVKAATVTFRRDAGVA